MHILKGEVESDKLIQQLELCRPHDVCMTTLKVFNSVELNVKTLYLVIRLLTLNFRSSLLLNIGFVRYQEKQPI